MLQLIDKPSWIPCITSKVHFVPLDLLKLNKKHLISVSSQVPLVKAQELTIVDCRTYGLHRNQQIDPVKHYSWYLDFVKEHQQETDLVFIPPDADWLSIEIDQFFARKWLDTFGETLSCLVVPGTAIFRSLKNPVGYAIRSGQNVCHPKWTHSFSRAYNPSPKRTDLWTYDSLIS